MRIFAPFVVLLSLSLVFTALPCSALATDSACPDRMLFDRSADVKYRVETGGASYHVCEYDNLLGFLSGIAVYDSNNSRVEEPYNILRAAAWQTRSTAITAADIALLENISSTAEYINAAVELPYRVTSSAVAAMTELKNFELMGQSAWSAAVGAVPQLADFDNALSKLNNDFYSWFSRSRDVAASNRELASLLGANASYGQLSPAFQKAVTGMNSLASNVDDLDSVVGSVVSRISPVRSGLERAASAPFIGLVIGSAADVVRSVEATLSDLQSRLRSLSGSMKSQASRFSSLAASVERDATTLYGQWQQRQAAATKLDIVLAAVAIAAAVPFLFLASRKIRGASLRTVTNVERVFAALTVVAALTLIFSGIPLRMQPYIYVAVIALGLALTGAWLRGLYGAVRFPAEFVAWSFVSAISLIVSYGASVVFYTPPTQLAVVVLYAAGVVAISQLLRVFIRQCKWSYKTLAVLWRKHYEGAVKTAVVASAPVFFIAAFILVFRASVLFVNSLLFSFFQERMPVFMAGGPDAIYIAAVLLALLFEFRGVARKPPVRQETDRTTAAKLEAALKKLDEMRARKRVDERSYRKLRDEYARKIRERNALRSQQSRETAKIRKTLKELELRNSIGELTVHEFRARRAERVKALREAERKAKDG